MTRLDNLNIRAQQVLVTPEELKQQLPVSPALAAQVQARLDPAAQLQQAHTQAVLPRFGAFHQVVFGQRGEYAKGGGWMQTGSVGKKLQAHRFVPGRDGIQNLNHSVYNLDGSGLASAHDLRLECEPDQGYGSEFVVRILFHLTQWRQRGSSGTPC